VQALGLAPDLVLADRLRAEVTATPPSSGGLKPTGRFGRVGGEINWRSVLKI
jgi:hypothetical protein